MKKNVFISVLLAITMLMTMIPFSSAVDIESVTTEIESTTTEVVDLGDGFTEVITTTVFSDPQARSTSKTRFAQKQLELTYYGEYLGTFILGGKFTYDGTSAEATYDTWNASAASGYNYTGTSSHSGAKVKGSCTFYNNTVSKTITGSITCDKDGNVS